MEIVYTQKAAKQFRDLPRQIQERIAGKMIFFSEQSDPIKFAKRLVDHKEGEYCFRIGDWRVIFDVTDDKIFVLKIAKRDKIYD